MAKSKARTIEVYDVNDIMAMLDCSKSYAYGIIKKLREEIEQLGYLNIVPAGKIQKSYFDKRLICSEVEANVCVK